MRLVVFVALLLVQEGAPERPRTIPEVLVWRRQAAILELQNKVLAAQLAQEQIGPKLAQIEKDAGCAVDWQANPPICKETK